MAINIERLKKQKREKKTEKRGFRIIEDGEDKGGCEDQLQYPFGEGRCANCGGPLSRYNQYFICNVCKSKISSDSLAILKRRTRDAEWKRERGNFNVFFPSSHPYSPRKRKFLCEGTSD